MIQQLRRTTRTTPKKVKALLDAVNEHGAKWTVIGKKLGKPARVCRGSTEGLSRSVTQTCTTKPTPALLSDPKNVDVLVAAAQKHGNDSWKAIISELCMSASSIS